jgi:hypothetical protein
LRRTFAIFAVAALAALHGCSKSDGGGSGSDDPKRPDDAPKATGPGPGSGEPDRKEAPKRPDGPTGTIRGKVAFSGEAPEMPRLQRGADPVCARKEMNAETVVVNDNGTLRDAHVRIARGAVPGWVPEQPVVVDQVDCMYRPRVQGGVVGQALEIRNSDKTSHNVHVRAMMFGRRQAHETIFNRGQPADVLPIRARVEDEEVIMLKCDQHAWMQGYVVVSDHPYFDTTGEDGSFTIEHAPVGTYELQAWHALYGVKTVEVTVEEGETADVEFGYDAQADGPGQPESD